MDRCYGARVIQVPGSYRLYIGSWETCSTRATLNLFHFIYFFPILSVFGTIVTFVPFLSTYFFLVQGHCLWSEEGEKRRKGSQLVLGGSLKVKQLEECSVVIRTPSMGSSNSSCQLKTFSRTFLLLVFTCLCTRKERKRVQNKRTRKGAEKKGARTQGLRIDRYQSEPVVGIEHLTFSLFPQTYVF